MVQRKIVAGRFVVLEYLGEGFDYFNDAKDTIAWVRSMVSAGKLEAKDGDSAIAALEAGYERAMGKFFATKPPQP